LAKGHAYKFVVFNVEEDKFGPKVSLLCGFDDFGNVDPGNEELQVFHDFAELVGRSPISLRNSRLAGLYLLKRIDNSVKIPMCARSKLKPASKRPIISSKWPRRS
jgi:hypothetical protein